MCTLELLSAHKINSFKSMRNEELALLINFIQEAACGRVTVDLSAKLSSLRADISCLMVFGKEYKDKELDERVFKAVLQEGMHLAATPNFGDYIPCLAQLTSKVLILENNFVAGLARRMDTTATATEWTLFELIKHPHVMKMVQNEMENVVGMERMVEESDLEKLEYLDMVLKETVRLHPVAPLLLPHTATEDCNANGFHLLRKSRVMINIWAIGRDPNVWIDAEKFIPERFGGRSTDFRGRDFHFILFGFGRRGCPAMQLGITMVQLMAAQLVHCFDWELPNNMLPTELDMKEEFDLTFLLRLRQR